MLYVVRHDWMATELRRVLRGVDTELFKVCTLDNLVPTLMLHPMIAER